MDFFVINCGRFLDIIIRVFLFIGLCFIDIIANLDFICYCYVVLGVVFAVIYFGVSVLIFVLFRFDNFFVLMICF